MIAQWGKTAAFLMFILLMMTACANEAVTDTNEDTGKKETTNDADMNPSTVQHQEVLNIAHRGASGSAPEATAYAFDQAADVEQDWLEMDVQKTKDGELVAIHDDDIERTTNAEGEVGDYTLEELQDLDAGSWFNEENPDQQDKDYEDASIMALEEVFERYGTEQNYYIEVKSPELNEDMEKPMVDLIEKFDLIDNDSIIVQSFNQNSLKTIHDLNAAIPLIQLLWWEVDEDTGESEEWHDVTPAPEDVTDDDYEEMKNYAAGIGANLSYEDTEVIDEDFVQKTLDHDLLFHVYTVNQEEEMERMINWGVTGIFTNYPERLQRVIEKMENDV